MTTLAIAQSDRIGSRAWLRHGAALAIVLLLTLVAFRSSVAAAIEVWEVSPTYSHCFLIIPIVLWLIWEKRGALAMAVPGVAPSALAAIPVLSLVWWIGTLSSINEVQQYAVVGIIQTLIVAFLGFNVVRLIWFPVFYLLFLVPTGEYLIVPMQHFATVFVDISLNLLGIPHYTEGTTFELTNGRFEIAEACAGLRFLIATVTLGVLYSYMMFRKLHKAVLFLLACVAVPLIGNGLRCVGIITLAHFTNNEYGAGADHIVYGWGFNVAILLVLGLLGSMFRDEMPDKPQVRLNPPVPASRLALVTLAAAGLLATGPALAAWHDNYFVRPDPAAITPVLSTDWRQGPLSSSWKPRFAGLDAQTTASLVPAADPLETPVDLFVGYYARPRPGHALTARANQLWSDEGWTSSDARTIKASLAGKPLVLREQTISSRAQKRLVWSYYWIDENTTTSLFRLKLMQAAAALKDRDSQAVIALSTVVDGTVEDARARLTRALGALDQLPARLAQAGRSTADHPIQGNH